MKILYFIILVLILFFMTDCEVIDDISENGDTKFIYVTPRPDPTPITSPSFTPIIELGAIEFSLTDGKHLYFYDGENLADTEFTGVINSAGVRKVAIDNILYYFDGDGNIIKSKWLNIIPDAVLLTDKLTRQDVTEDIWTFESITPQEAYDLGAMFKPYTRIFKNGVEQGNWFDNQFKMKKPKKLKENQVIIIDDVDRIINITDDKDINMYVEDGMMIYDIDYNAKNCYIGDESGDKLEAFTYNFFYGAMWILANNKWYSNNGYTWNYDEGLKENCNSLWDFNIIGDCPPGLVTRPGNYPFIIPAGIQVENGEEVIYYAECNTGHLVRYIPSIDQIDVLSKLYYGDGLRTSGALISGYLDPEWIEDKLYFHYDNSLQYYDKSTGEINIFSEDMEVIEW